MMILKNMYSFIPSMDVSNLHEYGIQTENSTHRIHIDPCCRNLFIYKTEDGIKALPEPIIPAHIGQWEGMSGMGYVLSSQGKYKEQKIATARGYKANPNEITNCMCISIQNDINIPGLVTQSFNTIDKNGDRLTTSYLGNLAVSITQQMFAKNLIPITDFRIQLVNKRAMQIQGIDANCNLNIQIKCDRWCSLHGLYLQTHEWNPYGYH